MPPSSCGWKQGPEATPQGHRGHPQRTTQAPVLDFAACAEMRPTSAYICGLVKAAQTDWTMTFHSSQHCNGLREARAPRTAPSPYCPPPSVLCNAPTASCVSTTPQPLPLKSQHWRVALENNVRGPPSVLPRCTTGHLVSLVLSYPTAELQDEQK